jgi:hypothetical protein
MNASKTLISIVSMIALAVPAIAADKPDSPAAKQLEKQVMGYWAPDAEAMIKIITEKKIMPKEEAAEVIGEMENLTIHTEPGTAHVYTKQGVVSTPYEIVEADQAAKTLTVRAVSKPEAPKAQSITLSIKDGQVTVLGGEGQLPIVFKKIDEAEFAKRKAAVPAEKVGP